MTIQQIAKQIDTNNWAFTLYQTKPNQKRLAHHTFGHDNTADFITNLVKENGCEEIQIVPEKRNGSAFKQGFAKTITINFKEKTMPTTTPENITALTGLAQMGLNMADIFTAKEKAADLTEFKAKNAMLEERLKSLEFENMKLENKLEMQALKKNNESKLMDLAKSPQLLSVLASVFSKTPAPAALGTPAENPQIKIDAKTKYIINYLDLESTPDALKDLFIYITKAHQHENAAKITEEIISILAKHNIIKTGN